MTLKEKFENNIIGVLGEVKIADDFAIGFAEWFELNSIYNGSEFLIYIEDNKQYKIKQFLEIYKKEKGL